ncbi:hypothetical protein [Peribacillus frigoritolerans]|uniref:Uncharacterized protein n=2 Tax=Bacillaceae TaxID=186817 RepID=A0AAW9NHJ6_9BACI|nr:hypothetical protein [Peribacillus castrilensis]
MVIAIGKEKGLESMIAKEGEAILNKENQFRQNINSEDPFIKNLYSDLNERINAYEQEDAVKIEKMKWSDATGSIFFMILIIAYLIYSLV